MPTNATDILENAESTHERVSDNLRDGANWFHDHEGELFDREEVLDGLTESLDIDRSVASDVLAELTGDTVDPVVQVQSEGVKYYGVIDYVTFEGAYGYIDYHDYLGARRRVVCAQCVQEATVDSEVTHATAGDPSGSFSSQPDASYEELLEAIEQHYTSAHEGTPETVETGASLASPTTIGGNTAWHAGNDGSNSTLDADSVDGLDKSDIVEVAGDTMTGELTVANNNPSYHLNDTGGGIQFESRWEINPDWSDGSGREYGDIGLIHEDDGGNRHGIEIRGNQDVTTKYANLFEKGNRVATRTWANSNLVEESGDTMSGDLTMGPNDIDFEADGIIRRSAGIEFDNQDANRYRSKISSSGTESETFRFGWRDTNDDSYTSFLTVNKNNDYLDFSHRSQDIRLATGQSIEDGGGTERVDILSAGTYISDENGNTSFRGSDSFGNSIFARSGQPASIYDKEQGGNAVQYDTDPTAGVLRTPNASLHVESNGTPSTEGLSLRYDTATGIGTIRARDWPTGTSKELRFEGSIYDFSFNPADLRLATGQAIEDGGGTDRLLITSNNTVINSQNGTKIWEASQSNYTRWHAQSDTPVEIRDREGGFTGVQYDTDASAGVLRTPGAGTRIEANGTPSSGAGVETIYDTGQNQGVIRSYNRDTTAHQTLLLEGSPLELSGRGGLVDMSVSNADLRIATGQAIEDGSGNTRIDIGSTRTVLRNEEQTASFGAYGGSKVEIQTESDEPLIIRDNEGAFDAVKYDTDATAGVLRTPNAGARIESDGVPSLGSGVEVLYDSSASSGLIRAFDRDTSTVDELELIGSPLNLRGRGGLIDASVHPADLRLATGQAIEDGGGTGRLGLNTNATELYDDGGTNKIRIASSFTNDIQLRTNNALGIRDNAGGYWAVEYTTSATAPGTLSLPYADLDIQNNTITTDNFEVTENSTTNSLDFNYTG